MGFAAPLPTVIKGDFAAEPRVAGHVDVQALVQSLKASHANTYFWLIWHGEHDWTDLQYFLPLAREAGIQVWVYLVPPSETPAGGGVFKLYSEPYRLDYVRWAQEIATLSLAHDNLMGYVIDDFWENTIPGRFTPEYAAQVASAGKSVNPKLRFFPLIYFHELEDPRLVDLEKYADGMVVAYPPSAQAIRDKQYVWQGKPSAWSGWKVRLGYAPVPKSASAGIERQVSVSQHETPTLRFAWKDNYSYFRRGQRALAVTVDDQDVYLQDLATYQNETLTLALNGFLKPGQVSRLAVGIRSLDDNARLPVTLEVGQIELAGVAPYGEDWNRFGHSQVASVSRNTAPPKMARSLPVILMTAAEHEEYAKRYGVPATAQSIAERVSELLQLSVEGVRGVVTYCLDKTPGSPDHQAVAWVYSQ